MMSLLIALSASRRALHGRVLDERTVETGDLLRKRGGERRRPQSAIQLRASSKSKSEQSRQPHKL